MRNADPTRTVFGPFELDQTDRVLTCDGVAVTLGGRAMDLLIVLAAASGETIDKYSLLDKVWPGVVVEENNLQVQISALRKALGEGSIITVPGRGYRLNMSVPHENGTSAQSTGRGKPSLAVLPFINLTGDAEQEYFADGVADDIRTELSRNRSLFVIARNTSSSYRAEGPLEAARDLRVQYIIEGSVRRSGDRIRITAQLIDTTTSSHIWASRFDRKIGDMFSVQDEIARAVVTAIDPAIGQIERQRAIRKQPDSLSAWEAWHQALWHWSPGGDLSAPRRFLEQAVALDPQLAPAHALLSHIYLSETTLGVGPAMSESLKKAEASARTAVRVDPESSIAHAMMAWVFDHQSEPEAGLAESEVAISLNPNDPQGYVSKGHILVYSTRPEAGREPLEMALILDPRGPTAATAMLHRVIGRYFERDYISAEALAREVIRTYPEFPRPYPWHAAALGQLGHASEAKVALARAMEVAKAHFDFIMSSKPPYYRAEGYQHLKEGFARAGWRPSR